MEALLENAVRAPDLIGLIELRLFSAEALGSSRIAY